MTEPDTVSESKLPLRRAMTLALGRLEQPVITEYQLAVLLFRLYQSKKFGTYPLRLKKAHPDSADLRTLVNDLLELGVLNPNNDFPRSTVYNILGKSETAAEEILCSVDPFAYLSHLSAMEYHGLTNRVSKVLCYSTPAQKEWQVAAIEKMRTDIGSVYEEQYHESGLPLLTTIKFTKINKRHVTKYSSLHKGAFKLIKGRMLRMATIGRTFLDMLRRPDLCGGMNHVLEVFRNYAKTNLNLIIDELNTNGTAIEKVRAGYILEEECNVKTNPTIESWRNYVQRGGSRKLDPYNEYSSTYSERWCLSINI
jgi:predicted transcriptional regulator of viral defense system